LIGEGGMGQVYRGTDTTLGRQVAIKILPDAPSSDADRLARFELEAKVLASLNHPHIAAIYGFERSAGMHALVMELVEGEDLSKRVARGAMPLDEALPIARQIAEALEAAHAQGIIHRDLKPANIKVRPDGTVKVLDFGLAKAFAPVEAMSASVSLSPTITTPAMTQAGIILGTAAYMSPEQARGKPVDKRADIWAFGCVLFEMLTGTRAFPGEDVTDTLANVLKREPDWLALPPNTPLAMRTLMQRCLEKEPRQRIADISTALFVMSTPLVGVSANAEHAAGAQTTPTWLRIAPWAVALVLLAALGAVSFVHFRERPVAELSRFEIPAPANVTLLNQRISPDGRSLAFTARDPDGRVRVWVRTFDSLDARPLPGTDGAANAPPFWSPDSQHIAFAISGKLKKVEAVGGPVQTVCDLPGAFRGGAWGMDGTIVIGVAGRGLMRVPERGVPAALTTLDSGRNETDHVNPSFLPDGRHFVYAGGAAGGTTGEAEGRIYLGSLDEVPERQTARPLATVGFPNAPVYAPSQDPRTGHLLFAREGSLVAVPFDASRFAVTGPAVPIVNGVAASPASYSASTTGILAFRTSLTENIDSQLLWFDRQGKQLGQLGPHGPYNNVQLSPDGSLVVVDYLGSRGTEEHLWSADTARGVFSRVNPGEFRDFAGSAVAPDGRVVFTSTAGGVAGDLHVKHASGAGTAEPLVTSATLKHANHWSLDGRFVIYDDHTAQRQDLWIVPLAGDRKPIPFLVTAADETDANFSPDTRWVAYSSDESGRREVYVQGFAPDLRPAAGVLKRQLSPAGGAKPRWRRDGQELYYKASDGKLMAVPVKTTATTFEVGVAVPLFETSTRGFFPYDVAADGRFLVNTVRESGVVNAAPITVVLNWAVGLEP
jgi:Tol biopolymer transport system component